MSESIYQLASVEAIFTSGKVLSHTATFGRSWSFD